MNLPKKKWQKSSEELVEKFNAAMNDLTEIDRRKMFGYPCAFVNGNMFTGLHEQNWIIRLDEKSREKFIAKFDSKIFEPFPGRLMHEYVVLTEAVKGDSKTLKSWLNTSLNYAQSLPRKLANKPKIKSLK